WASRRARWRKALGPHRPCLLRQPQPPLCRRRHLPMARAPRRLRRLLRLRYLHRRESSTAPASGAGATGAAAGAAATSPASQSAAQALAMNSMGMMMPGMMMPGFSGYDMLSAMGMAGMGMGMAMPGMGMMGMPTMPGMMPGMLPQQPESGSAKAAPKAAA
ncbi:unnamed protein product, partial [Effrenium voratum]